MYDGRYCNTKASVSNFSEELVEIKEAVGEQAYDSGRYAEAAELFRL